MNMMSSLRPGRAIAQHCDELVRTGPRPEERAEHVAQWRREVARQLAGDFAALLSGDRARVSVSEPELLRGEEVFARIGPLAANSLLRCGGDERTALLSFNFPTAIALMDRSFGGDGAIAPDEAPEALPSSAAMLIGKVAGITARVIATVASGEDTLQDQTLPADVIARSENAARLKPFTPGDPCFALTLTVTSIDGREWTALLAFAEPVLDRLLPGLAGKGPARATGRRPADGNTPPFASIPLPIEGVLAEFEMSLARLERLAPGDEIVLAVPGELPLRVGSRVFAWGQLGTQEDRIAVRLSRIPDQGPTR